jgi:AraC-like DNA-binding protein
MLSCGLWHTEPMVTRAILRRHEDSHGVQEWVETEPAPELGPWIAGYTGYREEADACVQRLETPSGGAVLVLSFGDPLTVCWPASGTGLPVRSAAAGVVTSFAGGISDRPVLTAHVGHQHGVQVRLGPLAVYALFGIPLDELDQHPGGVIDLAELGAGDWGARLGAARSWELRFALLDDLLMARLARRSGDPTPEVARAWRRLRSSHGGARVSELVRESGLSHRAFLGRFRRQVGVAPKAAARILRYERATALLEAGTRSVAEVAALSGYADQAHLDREFAALAGRSPTRLRQQRAGAEYQSIRSILFKTGSGDGATFGT